MRDSRSNWTEYVSVGDSVALSPKSSDQRVSLNVYSIEEQSAYFLIDEDNEALDAFRFDNRVELSAREEGCRADGTIQIIDVGPSAYEEETGDRVDFDDSSHHLLRFDVRTFQPPERNNPVEVEPDRPSSVVSWLKACRFYSLSASLVPMLLGIAYAVWMEWGLDPLMSILALAGGVSLHLATNLHNDVSDHIQGIDRFTDYGGAGVIQKGWLSARAIWFGALTLYALGVLCGIPLLWIRGGSLLVVGMLGFIGASTYSLENYGTKYSGLGDFSVFVLMGPLMALGAGIAASGEWSWTLVLVSVPVGFFVALILHGNNIHDIPIDRRAGATTLAIVLGFRASKTYYLLLLFGGYATVGALVVFDMAPVSTLLTGLTLPLALRHFTIIREAQNPLNPDLGKLRFHAARLHLLVGILYVIGFMVPVGSPDLVESSLRGNRSAAFDQKSGFLRDSGSKPIDRTA